MAVLTLLSDRFLVKGFGLSDLFRHLGPQPSSRKSCPDSNTGTAQLSQAAAGSCLSAGGDTGGALEGGPGRILCLQCPRRELASAPGHKLLVYSGFSRRGNPGAVRPSLSENIPSQPLQTSRSPSLTALTRQVTVACTVWKRRSYASLCVGVIILVLVMPCTANSAAAAARNYRN